MKQRYNKYSDYLKNLFGAGIRKIPVNAGFTCPNRDGSKGTGGCTYCNNVSFNPFYGIKKKSVVEQLNNGIEFYSKRYSVSGFLVYFQAYTNTYDEPEELKKIYSEVLEFPRVLGIIIGTRPDCISEYLLEYFSKLSKRKYVSIEYGIESSHDRTLEYVNRCHTYSDTISAISQTAEYGLHVGAHVILGLPGETDEMIIQTADRIAELPVNSIKIHQLQIIKQTVMAKQFAEHPESFRSFTVDQYVDLVVEFLEHLRPDIVIERFISESPLKYVLHPRWNGVRTYDFAKLVQKRMEEKNSWQGKLFKSV
ncbi:MAG: TIGR01212 family radical SAM protein [Melioribacteraceae bacterium]|nr:TIGR01212 family radical SAM protein [Melioribacteraceae bacterium]